MAGTPQVTTLSEKERKELLAQQHQKPGAPKEAKAGKDGTAVDDLLHGVKVAGKWAGDNLVSGKSWKDIAHGDATTGDYVNAGVDVASFLIPGGALAGGAARIGGRALLRQAEKQGAKTLAERAAARGAARSAAKTAGAGAGAVGRAGRAASESVRAPLLSRAVGSEAGKSTAAVGERYAGKGAGRVGRQAGLAQTKRTAVRNAGLLAGANFGENLYDYAKGYTTPTGDTKKTTPGAEAGAAAGGAAYLIGNQLYPLPMSGSGEMQVPPGVQRALSDYYNNGGTADGAQIVYMRG
jgi:hypothetical protein